MKIKEKEGQYRFCEMDLGDIYSICQKHRIPFRKHIDIPNLTLLVTSTNYDKIVAELQKKSLTANRFPLY